MHPCPPMSSFLYLSSMMRGPLLHKIFKEAPLSFPLSSSQVNILRDPSEFYVSLLEGIGMAKSKITLASLYLGSSESEIVRPDPFHKYMHQP